MISDRHHRVPDEIVTEIIEVIACELNLEIDGAWTT